MTIPDPASSSHEITVESLVREIALESFGVSIGVGIDSPVFGPDPGADPLTPGIDAGGFSTTSA